MKKVGVVGAGAWGTALAVIANRAGSDVTLWARNRNVVESIYHKNSNDQYLPDVFLDPAIQVTSSLEEVCQSELILLVVPAQHMRSTCIAMSHFVPKQVPLIICCKGVERSSLMLMSEVVKSVLPHNQIGVLSGPNFAYEVAKGMPSATAIACTDDSVGEQMVFALGSSSFRPYLHNDLIGAQVGGAVKNVLAIACGIAMGKKLGENARAAVITRGIAEIRRLCLAKGGKEETLMGLAGMGDIILTCTSNQSRNTSLGFAIGQGKTMEEVLSRRDGVTEGVASAEAVKQLAEQLDIRMPICQAVYEVLYNDLPVEDAIHFLIGRPFVRE